MHYYNGDFAVVQHLMHAWKEAKNYVYVGLMKIKRDQDWAFNKGNEAVTVSGAL